MMDKSGLSATDLEQCILSATPWKGDPAGSYLDYMIKESGCCYSTTRIVPPVAILPVLISYSKHKVFQFVHILKYSREQCQKEGCTHDMVSKRKHLRGTEETVPDPVETVSSGQSGRQRCHHAGDQQSV